MNKVSKGNYYRKRTKDFYEKDGWRVDICEKNQRIFTPKGIVFVKKDLWGADLIAAKGEEMMFIQCKTNRSHINLGLKEFRKYPVPSSVKQIVVIWEPRAKEPEVCEVEKE